MPGKGLVQPVSATSATAAAVSMVRRSGWVMVRSCLVSCCSDWNVAWGLAGRAADEHPAPTEGAFNDELRLAETKDQGVLNISEINILDVYI